MQGNNRAKLHIFFLTTIFTTELLHFNLIKNIFYAVTYGKKRRLRHFRNRPLLLF